MKTYSSNAQVHIQWHVNKTINILPSKDNFFVMSSRCKQKILARFALLTLRQGAESKEIKENIGKDTIHMQRGERVNLERLKKQVIK